jgi:hypothetical protein
MIGAALLMAAAAGPSGACPPEAPAAMVAQAAPFGGVIAPTAAEAGEAVAAGMLAREAAHRYLGLDAPPFLIVASSPGVPAGAGGCAFVFPWAFPRSRDGGSRLPSHVLPHEIGHSLFIRFLAPRTGADEYGGGAPDWLDEMAGIAFEDDSGVRMRRGEAWDHARSGALIPLARLLAMPHPEWSARRTASGAAAAGPPLSQPESPDTPAFYATLRALFDFLVQRTGDEQVVRRLADRARTGAPLDEWLLAWSGPGPAADGLSRLDAQLAAFVLADPAYRAARAGGAAETPG